MSKRKAFSLGDSISQQKKFDKRHASVSSSSSGRPGNPFQKHPIFLPEKALYFVLHQSRQVARDYISKVATLPISRPFCEIEARIGISKTTLGAHDKRVLPSGPKTLDGKMAHAFDITALNNKHIRFEGGVTRTHFGVWTSAGLSESSAISAAFGVDREGKIPKQELVEKTLVETVYGGYNNQNRMCFPGEHVIGRSKARNGVFENKSKLVTRDFALPAAPYDLRVTLSTEQDLKSLGEERYDNPISGWTSRRLKRRRSYTRSGFVWQLDVTEVTTSSSFQDGKSVVEFEIEVELNAESTLKLINEKDEEQCRRTCKEYAGQLWWMISNINPLSDVLDVEDFLENHPNKNATNLAVGQCGALKKFMDSRRDGGQGNWAPAIGPSKVSSTPSQSLKFPGCMPVNFSRHHIEEVQRSDSSGGYYLSEKTDGVRYFMIFTGETVVLVDRTMTGKRVKPRDGKSEPMSHLLPLIKPGTVFDGEVVMNRKYRRPIFIVFDVLTISDTQPILQLPFQERLKHLTKASFRTNNADKDMFDKRLITDKSLNISLPLARKNFVSRMEIDEKLLSHVSVDRGLRSYKNGDHYHLTDGIIFQPNLPYSCGTDVNLLKWKYLDTVTIDVQIVPPKFNDDEDVLRVEVSGEDGSFVDMTRFIHLPNSERRRLEADREETKAKIVEVGFEPTTGEWYYLTMRPDKIAPNHISTVLGTLLELAESLNTEELRYRMSVPSGNQDTYRKQIRRMQKQLLEHQRSENKKLSSKRR